MNINLHIQAIDGDDLRRQLRSILGEDAAPGPIPVVQATAVAETDKTPEATTTEADKPKTKPARTRQAAKESAPETATDALEPVAEATQEATQEAAQEGESGSGVKTAEPSEPSEASDAPVTSSSTSAATTASAGGSDAVTIDTIRELTLSVVDKRGKEGIEAVLSEFGVQRSTQVPEAQWGELAAALRDALED